MGKTTSSADLKAPVQSWTRRDLLGSGWRLGWLWSLGIGEGSTHAQKGSGRFISGTRRTQKLLREVAALGPVPRWAAVMLEIAKPRVSRAYHSTRVLAWPTDSGLPALGQQRTHHCSSRSRPQVVVVAWRPMSPPAGTTSWQRPWPGGSRTHARPPAEYSSHVSPFLVTGTTRAVSSAPRPCAHWPRCDGDANLDSGPAACQVT